MPPISSSANERDSSRLNIPMSAVRVNRLTVPLEGVGCECNATDPDSGFLSIHKALDPSDAKAVVR